jgi:hypothetical protein
MEDISRSMLDKYHSINEAVSNCELSPQAEIPLQRNYKYVVALLHSMVANLIKITSGRAGKDT